MKIVYEDKDILIIDKPSGLVIYPGAGEEKKTVLGEFDKLGKKVEIVHRLDKDTSGLLILAKNLAAKEDLQKQMKERKIQKEYLALVLGKVEPKKGEISLPIRRHPKHRRKMTISYLSFGKPALTKYKVIKYLKEATLLVCQPITGRMHQIRVHLKHLGHPVLGDQTYKTKISNKISKSLGLSRQFLHAHKIKIKHPSTKKTLEFKSPLPKELKKVLSKIKVIVKSRKG